MARIKIALIFLLLILAFGAAQAQSAAPVGLLIYDAWVRPTAPALADGATEAAPLPGTVAGAYLTIENTSAEDYQLVGMNSGLAEMTMLHQTTVDSKGIARMQMIGALDIPAGQTVSFAPGNYHVMLMNIAHDIYPGDAVALTLTFASADGSTIDIPVAALALDAAPPDDTLIAANAVATVDPRDDKALDVSLLLDNRSADAETLTGALSTAGTANFLSYPAQGRVFPYSSIEIAAQAQTALSAPDGIFIRMTNITHRRADAFALTLTFESGKTLTVAVPVVGAAS